MDAPACRPVLTGLQLAPSSVDRKTPPPSVPTKTLVPSTASTWTNRFVRPALTDVQCAPPSTDRDTPPPSLPAKTWLPTVTIDTTNVGPAPVGAQLEPPSDEVKTPLPVPTSNRAPSVARVKANRFVRPVFDGFHVRPSLTDRNTPPPSVVAKT